MALCALVRGPSTAPPQNDRHHQAEVSLRSSLRTCNKRAVPQDSVRLARAKLEAKPNRHQLTEATDARAPRRGHSTYYQHRCEYLRSLVADQSAFGKLFVTLPHVGPGEPHTRLALTTFQWPEGETGCSERIANQPRATMAENVLQMDGTDHASPDSEPRYSESSCSDNESSENIALKAQPMHAYDCEQIYYPAYVFESDMKASNMETNQLKAAAATTAAGANNASGEAQPGTERSRSFRATCCSIVGLMLGTMLIAIGFLTIVMPISDFVLISRLRMDPGLPPFEQWVKPKPEVRLSVYIFGVENADAFLNGTDAALRLTEIGPVVYREHLHHTHIEHHDNSTLSYTAERHIEFLADQNEPGILNRTILVPNFVVLATAAFINDDYFKKFGFKFMLRESDTMFVNITVYDYLWNYRSDLIGRIRTFAPFLVPTDNSGVLYQIYDNFNDRYNVRIGPKHAGNQFFEIATVNGVTVVPGFDLSRGECNASIIGATEGALYNTHLSSESVLWYWRKSLCRQVPLYFEKTVQKGAFDAYKYVLRENVYDRMANATADCYKGPEPTLPDGLSDLSKCFFDMPFAASNPHFFGRYPNKLTERLDGLAPSKERHQSFIIVEPTMGVPIDQSARSQSNVVIPDLYGFPEQIQRFSNMALPTFWVEYHQRKLTTEIESLMYFTLFILPVLQYFITAILLIAGFVLAIRAILRCMSLRLSDFTVTRSKTKLQDITWNIKR